MRCLTVPRPQRDKAVAVGATGLRCRKNGRSCVPDFILGADARPPHALLCIPMAATLSGQKPDSQVDFGSPHWLRMSFRPESPQMKLRILDPFGDRTWSSCLGRHIRSSPWQPNMARQSSAQLARLVVENIRRQMLPTRWKDGLNPPFEPQTPRACLPSHASPQP